VVAKNGHIEYAVCNSKSGLFAVKAKIFVDCTGDGDLCAMAGGECEMGENNDGKVMPGTLCSLWTDIEWDKVRKISPNSYIEQAYKDGVLSFEDRHLPGMFKLPNYMGGGNIGHLFDLDATDEVSLTQAMMWGRKSVLEYERYYKEYLKDGYENMRLCVTAPTPGVRESRRVTCDYTLCVDDFIKRAVFDDEIGRYCYPVDIHVSNTNKEEYERFMKEYEKDLRYGKGESYGIPYRSLVAKSFDNMLVAGRCMGTDRKMQASVRVMPGCFITGQAAGAAAALASESGETRKIEHSHLTSALKALGAFLPNA
ncbi:MAG: FAD-dependent oxidoreductase, partial [Clostridia bacterium]|nr:FAD-dependent oxidoreductase [Clostridia bacterium]